MGSPWLRVVILRATDIAVRHHGGGSGWTRQGLLVEIVFEDRFNTLVRTRTDADGAVAGGFKARHRHSVCPAA